VSSGLTITPGVPPHRHPAGSVTGLAAIATSGSSADITDSTAAGRSLLTAVDAAAQRTALSVPSVAQVAAGYQPLDADLTAIAALTTTTYGRSLLTGADAAATRTLLGLAAIAASGSASDLSSGAVPAARMPAHTGDVTSSAGSVALTVGAGAVTLAKMANLAANSIIGNNTGSAATPIALTAAQVRTLLALAAVATSGSAADLTGTLADARLSSNVALLGASSQNFTGLLGVGGAPVAGKGLLQVAGALQMLAANGGDFSTGVWSRDANWGAYYKPAPGTQADFAIVDSGGNQVLFLKNAAIGIGVAPTAGEGLLQLSTGTTKANGVLLGNVPVYRFQSYGLAIDTNSSAGHQVRIYEDSSGPTLAIRAADNVYAQLLFRTYNGVTEDDRFRARADGSGLLWQTWNGSAWTDMLKVSTAGALAFYGVSGSTRQTAAAAATDAATTQTLANSLRTILINLGLAQ